MNNSTPPYVLTLTIVDASTLKKGQITGDSLVMCCVRNSQVNKTHPDVVSVPTQRIPEELAQNIISTSTRVGDQADTILWEQEFVSNKHINGHNSVIFAVESLLSRKLGVSSVLEKNEIEFEAALVGTHSGTAIYKYQDKPDGKEQLQMINVMAYITKGADKFPEATTSFDDVKWAKVKNFLLMWDDGKDVTRVGVSFKKALGICVDGLCILSTYDILRAKTANH